MLSTVLSPSSSAENTVPYARTKSGSVFTAVSVGYEGRWRWSARHISLQREVKDMAKRPAKNSHKRAPKSQSNKPVDSKQDEPEAFPLTPVVKRIGESGTNLSSREAWFRKRAGETE